MRVRALRIVLLGTGEVEEHPAVSIGSTYLVPFLCVDPRDGPLVNILTDDGRSGGMWPIEMFETVDERIPSNWVCRYDEDGFLNLAPASWLAEGFFGDEYSSRPITEAERKAMTADYWRELEIIKRECG